MEPIRKTCIRINTSALRANIQGARAFLPNHVRLMMVVKADAYGHGLEAVGALAQEEGADFLAVAIAEEGIALRKAGISLPIFCFGALNNAGFEAAAAWGLTATIADARGAHLAAQAANHVGKHLDVHLKMETGMNRVGIAGSAELGNVLTLIEQSPWLRLKGAYTHFADSDAPGNAYTHQQAKRFMTLCEALPEGLLLHAGASGGALFYPEYHFDMVRMGIALYGYPPDNSPVLFQPCLELVAEVTFVKEIAAGESVGYGCSFTAPQAMRVATLGIGYGDGYPRALSNCGRVLIHGVACPVIGRVCMDQCMVDVSALKQIAPGDEAVMIGSRGGLTIGADELAQLCETIPYEILLLAAGRVPRYYTDKKEILHASE